MKVRVVKGVGRKVRRAGRVYSSVWFSRITSAISELVAMRHMIGRASEGELGLAIAKFIKESFKSIGVVRRVSKLSSTTLGKTYIAYTLLDIVKKLDPSKVKGVLEDIKGIKDKNGLEFFEGIMNIVNNRFSGDIKNRIDRILSLRLSNAIVSENAIYDPISERLIARDMLSGKIISKKLRLKNTESVLELFSYGIKDKDIFVNYAEWRMLKIVNEGMSKGLSRKDLGLYVFTRLREELDKDSVFFESFKYYLATHIEKLEKSELAAAGFGELMIQVMRINRRLIAAAMRAATAIPIFGTIVEPMIGTFEGFGELCESLGESLKRANKDGNTRTIKVDLNRKDSLFEFF